MSQESGNAEWLRALEYGRKLKFIYQTAPGGGSVVTAQIAANEILLTEARTPSHRKPVESHFRRDLSKK